MMNYGDAFNDMPEEYRQHRLNHDAAIEPIGKAVDVEVAEDSLSFRIENESEADKAIADGKPRWMRTNADHWYYVIFYRREQYGNDTFLMLKECSPSGEPNKEGLTVQESSLQILPYGETPPPAKPEKIDDAETSRYELPITGGKWWMEESQMHEGYFRIYGNLHDATQSAKRVCEMVEIENAQAIINLRPLLDVCCEISVKAHMPSDVLHRLMKILSDIGIKM